MNRFFTVFMGSSRYFSKYEIEYEKLKRENLISGVAGGVITVKDKIMFDDS
jgi:hypothetical protein